MLYFARFLLYFAIFLKRYRGDFFLVHDLRDLGFQKVSILINCAAVGATAGSFFFGQRPGLFFSGNGRVFKDRYTLRTLVFLHVYTLQLDTCPSAASSVRVKYRLTAIRGPRLSRACPLYSRPMVPSCKPASQLRIRHPERGCY